MATNVIMPALEMAQETGKLVHWLKREGEAVSKGEPLMEIETDKVTVEIEAPASGTLAAVQAHEGDVIPVGRPIAIILGAGEAVPALPPPARPAVVSASPVARKMAEAHGVDLAIVKTGGGRVDKADVEAYLARVAVTPARGDGARVAQGTRVPASPKARRLAVERGLSLQSLHGSGPGDAVLASDVLAAAAVAVGASGATQSVGTVWRVMAERMSASWTSVPHIHLVREVDASALKEMHTRIAPVVEARHGLKATYTDLLVKFIAVTLRAHPRLNASWADGAIHLHPEINVGIAVAVDQGLIVPVIHNADALSVGEIAARREDLVTRAQQNKLRPADISGGTFTLTNLGMYHVDAFDPIVNSPQAAILAVGRIADRVVAVDGQPAVRPTLIATLACDHRVVDGARAAEFLDDLRRLTEEPWGLLA